MAKTRKITAIALLALASVLGAGVAQAQTADALVAEAWQANPSVAAMQQHIDAAASHTAMQAGTWPDPMLGVEYSNVPVDSLALGDHPMSGVQFKIEQRFPFPGKVARREATAAAQEDIARQNLSEKRNQLRAVVQRLYWRLTETRLARAITDRHIGEIERQIANVKAKYELGAAARHDLLRFVVLRDKLVDQRADFDRAEHELTSLLNAARNRDPQTAITTPAAVLPASPPHDENGLYEQALAKRPALAAFAAEDSVRRRAADEALREAWPDPTLWAGYRWRTEVENDQGMVVDEGVDFVSIGLAFPLPFSAAKRARAGEAEALARSRAAKQNRAAAANDLRGQLSAAVADWRRAFAKAKNYADLILPGQEQVLAAAGAAYRVGRAGYADIYAARVALLDAERTALAAATQTHLAAARVQVLVGADLPAAGVEQ